MENPGRKGKTTTDHRFESPFLPIRVKFVDPASESQRKSSVQLDTSRTSVNPTRRRSTLRTSISLKYAFRTLSAFVKVQLQVISAPSDRSTRRSSSAEEFVARLQLLFIISCPSTRAREVANCQLKFDAPPIAPPRYGISCEAFRRTTNLDFSLGSYKFKNAATQTTAAAGTGNRASARAAGSSYAARVDKFHGNAGENYEEWLFQINAIVKLERWSDSAKFKQAIAHLRGRAQAEYRALMLGDEELEWDEFELFIRTTFGPKNPMQHFTRALIGIRQGRHEDVATYSSRYRNALLRLQEVDPEGHSIAAIVLWYTKGLRSEFQVEMERDTPASLADAIASAEKAERVWKRQNYPQTIRSEHHPILSATTSEKSESEATMSRLIKQQSEIIKLLRNKDRSAVVASMTSEAPRVNDTKIGPCFYCKKPGHRIADCKKRLAKEKSATEVVYSSTG